MLPSSADRRRARRGRLAAAALVGGVAAAAMLRIFPAIALLAAATLLGIEALLPLPLTTRDAPARRRQEDRAADSAPEGAVVGS